MGEGKVLLIVGLGNPGAEYKYTRHNIGFHVLDELADDLNLQFKRERSFKAEVASQVVEGVRTVLVKPLTYMNLSGTSVGAIQRFYKVHVNDLMIVADDVELPLGKLRLRSSGGTGGHNGLKDIRNKLGTSVYARLRVGVGRGEVYDLSDHVLGRFTEEEWKEIIDPVGMAKTALLTWIKDGFKSAEQKINHLQALKNNRPDEAEK